MMFKFLLLPNHRDMLLTHPPPPRSRENIFGAVHYQEILYRTTVHYLRELRAAAMGVR